MNGIREWTLIICFASISASMLELISPDGKMEKMVRFVLGAFMICAFIFPLTNTLSNIEVDFKALTLCLDSSDFKSQAENQVKTQASEKIHSLTKKLLGEKNVDAEEINVFMDTNEKGCISIVKVDVLLRDQDANKKEEIIDVLKKELGVEVEVR